MGNRVHNMLLLWRILKIFPLIIMQIKLSLDSLVFKIHLMITRNIEKVQSNKTNLYFLVTMDLLTKKAAALSTWYDELWQLRDKRVDGWPLMSNPLYTVALCAMYVYVVKVAGPRFMKNRPPMNLKKFLVAYNGFQVVLSGYIFVQVTQFVMGIIDKRCI